MPYDYFYNGEAEQYIHYTLPKLFFKRVNDKETNVYENEELTGLSLNAKFLYSILLDKAKLSDKNGFTDEDGKLCVYYPQAKMAKLLHVERKQLYKYLNELDVKNGIGLIERRQKLGKGRTDCIYVKNFAKPIKDGETPTQTSNTKYKYFCDDDTASAARFNYYSLPKALFYDVDYAAKYTYPDEILELQKLSSNAKMAYTYFLYLLSLSMLKGKKDEYGRYFVICPEEDLKKLLGCCIQTVRQILNQLDINGGVGLIERSTDNPAIIYVLDYSARLSLSCKSKDKKSTHQNQKSTHQDEESTHQQSEKSTRQNQKSTHQDKKSTHQNKKSTHPIYNNPYFNNPDSIDTHSINQSASDKKQQPKAESNPVTKEMIDRLIDDKSKDNSFTEVLAAIGSVYAQYSEAQSEAHFEHYNENDRRTQECEIPYRLATDKNKVKEALKFLFAYSYRVGEMEPSEIDFLDSVIKALAELATQEKTKAGDRYVKYNEVIDALNNIVRNSSLMDFYDFNGFKEHWENILAQKAKQGINIPNHYGFMKSCLANFLIDYRVIGSAGEMEANGLIRKDFGDFRPNSKSNNTGTDKYDDVINDFPEIKANDFSETTEQSDNSETYCQSDKTQCSMSVIDNESEKSDTVSPDNSNAVQNSENSELIIDEKMAEIMARLRGQTEEQKQAERKRKEEDRKTKIRNAMFFKEMFEGQDKPLPNWVKEALAGNE